MFSTPRAMDPTSLDPRLREAHEDSIIVNNADQYLRTCINTAPSVASVASVASTTPATTAGDDSDDELHDPSPSPQQPLQQPLPLGQQPQQPFHSSTATAGPSFPPQTPSRNSLRSSRQIVPVPGPAAAPSHDPNDPNDPKRPRACEACRSLKVKCEFDSLDACKRCRKADRNCVVTPPIRKRQKKTDARVAALEKILKDIEARIGASQEAGQTGRNSGGAAGGVPSHAQSAPSAQPLRSAADNANTRIAKAWGPPVFPPTPNTFNNDQNPPLPQTSSAMRKRKFADVMDGDSDAQRNPGDAKDSIPDVVDRGLLTIDEVPALFERYTDRMAVHLPAVVFPPGMTAAEVRAKTPILFLSIMAAASWEEPDKQRVLVKELMQILADKLIVCGRKSLELIQALIVSSIWYYPPDHFEELKFYQLVHLAASMALDIGLGRRKNNSKSSLVPYTWADHPFRRHPLPDPSSIESRRTWLVVYLLTSNVAMALHRPSLIRWQSFMEECMDILKSSPEAAPSDRFLCHLVWTHRLAEEVAFQFSLDDPSVFVDIKEPKVQFVLRGFERDLAKYSEAIPDQDKQPTLLLGFSVMNLYMHEIALQTNEERTAPSSTEALAEPISGTRKDVSIHHISALASCLSAIDKIFKVFLSLDVATIRCLPIFNFVRITYALIVFVKIYFSASNTELGKIIEKENLNVAEYIEQLKQKFEETKEGNKSRPASKFGNVLNRVSQWYNTLVSRAQGQPRGEQNDEKSSSVESTFASQDNGPTTNSSHHQQPQANHAPPLNSADNRLQVLSEAATGNAPPCHPHHSGAPFAANLNASAYSNWIDPAPQPSSMYGGLPGPAPTGNMVVGRANQPHNMPWAPSTYGGDMSGLIFNTGSVYSDAFDLALTGTGENNPNDPVNQYNMQTIVQNDFTLWNAPHGSPPLNETHLYGEQERGC